MTSLITKITNGIIITDTLETGKSLYFEDGKITAITAENLPFDREIDAEGKYVSPGFVDIHTHGAGDCDFADNDKELILKACNTHAKYGTTTIFPTCTSSAFEDTVKFVENVRDRMKENAPGKPFIAGSHLEGPYFSDGQRGAQNPAYIKCPKKEEYTKFYEASDGTLARISFAPELCGSLELRDYLREKGVEIAAHIRQMLNVSDRAFDGHVTADELRELKGHAFPTLDPMAAEAFATIINYSYIITRTYENIFNIF